AQGSAAPNRRQASPAAIARGPQTWLRAADARLGDRRRERVLERHGGQAARLRSVLARRRSVGRAVRSRAEPFHDGTLAALDAVGSAQRICGARSRVTPPSRPSRSKMKYLLMTADKFPCERVDVRV